MIIMKTKINPDKLKGYADLKKINDYTIENFENAAIRYIKAIKQGRMFCIIDSVSSSGMSRNIRFISSEKGKTNYWFSNYYAFFKVLGFQFIKQSENFRIHGCGMDMVFHTNYTIIHTLHRIGFLNKKECDILAQKTPAKF